MKFRSSLVYRLMFDLKLENALLKLFQYTINV